MRFIDPIHHCVVPLPHIAIAGEGFEKNLIYIERKIFHITFLSERQI